MPPSAKRQQRVELAPVERRASAVPCSSTKRPASVMTTFMSTRAGYPRRTRDRAAGVPPTMPTLIAATIAGSGQSRAIGRIEARAQRERERDVGAGDRPRCACRRRLGSRRSRSRCVRSPSFAISVTARSARPMMRWISCVRPPTRPLAASRCVRSCGRARQHRVLGRHPAGAAPLHPRRNAIFDRGGAEHARVADADQHAALGVLRGSRARSRPGAARRTRRPVGAKHYSTVTVLARLRGWSTSLPSMSAMW